MTHWGWYWRVKRKHTPKALCSWAEFMEIDSFSMFKNKELVRLVKESKDRISFEIPKYNLIAVLQDDNSLRITFNNGTYMIPIEVKACNFGGFYTFFRCPKCTKGVRKLYCLKGRYICRGCANLGYYSQRLSPSARYRVKLMEIKNHLKDKGGSLQQKPPRMRASTFNKLRTKYLNYDKKAFHASNKALRQLYGTRIEPYLDWYMTPVDW